MDGPAVNQRMSTDIDRCARVALYRPKVSKRMRAVNVNVLAISSLSLRETKVSPRSKVVEATAPAVKRRQ